ncbi:MAG: hypothetical protein OXE86_18005 [Alphaproteobacteria bacterium]|nr:hypothetical protein [Alphaproteobacteria bacterium]
MNQLGTFGRWAFAEFTEIYEFHDEFDKLVSGYFPEDVAACCRRTNFAGIPDESKDDAPPLSRVRGLAAALDQGWTSHDTLVRNAVDEEGPVSRDEVLALLRAHKPVLERRFGPSCAPAWSGKLYMSEPGDAPTSTACPTGPRRPSSTATIRTGRSA